MVIIPIRDLQIFTRTVVKTIDVDASGTDDDFVLDNTAGNTTEQPKNVGAIIPAFASVIDCQLRCFETVAGSGSAVMSVDVGTTTGSDDLLGAGNVDSANDIMVIPPGSMPVILPAVTAQNVWVNFTPTANWSTLTAGRWAILVTYIDYSAALAQRNP